MSATNNTFAVTGLTCGHCVGAVTDELRALPGVSEVEIDLGFRTDQLIDQARGRRRGLRESRLRLKRDCQRCRRQQVKDVASGKPHHR